MQIIQSTAALRLALKDQTDIAFVPTMGNLHTGHIHLVKIAQQRAKCVVVSIFVNPLQFGPNEDLDSYPRTLDADCKKLKVAGAHIVFVPTVEEMYPDFDGLNLNQTMTIIPPPIANDLCGASRPGHFSGVATIVMKLFNIVQPSLALFGQKDFQQLFIIKQLVKQFNLPIEIIGASTVREDNGLAMSSRNGYLTPEQRNQASQLNSALQNIVNSVIAGSKDYSLLENQAKIALTSHGWVVDYVSIRSSTNLNPASPTDEQLVILGAAKLGSTRLIDNIEFLANSKLPSSRN
ncbi:MAG: pantoate--beta-alanine ligase [Methylotenera sp.]|nr:pantoate--beta-alanine ligase [Methylotenera sp.]